MDFLPDHIQKYVELHSAPESALLHQIDRETNLEVLKPRMLSGHLQGRVLSMLAHMIAPKYILEIGTYTGYATLCLAEGLQKEGRLITIEVNEELKERTSSYFEKSVYQEQIEFHIGDAQEIIPDLSYSWDMVFIDADKKSYQKYFELILPQVRKGGFILVDNVLWSGKVANSNENDKATETIRAFNQMVQDSDEVENVLMPVRDGIMTMRKL